MLTNKLVDGPPTTNTIPHVAHALWCAIQGGFKMEAAKPEVQLSLHNRVVPWSGTFVDEVKDSLVICRIL